jgi:hypothetical protein
LFERVPRGTNGLKLERLLTAARPPPAVDALYAALLDGWRRADANWRSKYSLKVAADESVREGCGAGEI